MTPKEFYKWCVDHNCENLEIIVPNDTLQTIHPVMKGDLRIIERKLWHDKPEQKCVFIDA